MVEGMWGLSGLARTQPGLALAFAIFMFSLAGIPPLAGFLAKFYIFLAAIDAGFYGLAVIRVLARVGGAYYYVRIVKGMYFHGPAPAFDQPGSPGGGTVPAVAAGLVPPFLPSPAPPGGT